MQAGGSESKARRIHQYSRAAGRGYFSTTYETWCSGLHTGQKPEVVVRLDPLFPCPSIALKMGVLSRSGTRSSTACKAAAERLGGSNPSTPTITLL